MESSSSILSSYLFAKFIHLRKVSGGCASQGGGVLHQHHLALVPLHLDHLARQGAGRQRVEPGHLFNLVCLEHLKNDYIAVRLKSKTAKEMNFEQHDTKMV